MAWCKIWQCASMAGSAALANCKAGLHTEGIAAMRQCSEVAMPLPVPLPYPRVFGPGLTRYGDLMRFVARLSCIIS